MAPSLWSFLSVIHRRFVLGAAYPITRLFSVRFPYKRADFRAPSAISSPRILTIQPLR